eukprot:NODE_2514_length_1181_cov_19.553004_g2296_i0.p2 GENE.NODE_2514_length_1181_cov_19.553004_g2296_i0~~NODE_2514_length_1181_cov_19.553004_g2296_i0.p2  ORF type:complete len:172 (-),score=24.79 NODE_2514_length_1181_cov_19.553004_g2296_i0:50-565(-)
MDFMSPPMVAERVRIRSSPSSAPFRQRVSLQSPPRQTLSPEKVSSQRPRLMMLGEAGDDEDMLGLFDFVAQEWVSETKKETPSRATSTSLKRGARAPLASFTHVGDCDELSGVRSVFRGGQLGVLFPLAPTGLTSGGHPLVPASLPRQPRRDDDDADIGFRDDDDDDDDPA